MEHLRVFNTEDEDAWATEIVKMAYRYQDAVLESDVYEQEGRNNVITELEQLHHQVTRRLAQLLHTGVARIDKGPISYLSNKFYSTLGRSSASQMAFFATYTARMA